MQSARREMGTAASVGIPFTFGCLLHSTLVSLASLLFIGHVYLPDPNLKPLPPPLSPLLFTRLPGLAEQSQPSMRDAAPPTAGRAPLHLKTI